MSNAVMRGIGWRGRWQCERERRRGREREMSRDVERGGDGERLGTRTMQGFWDGNEDHARQDQDREWTVGGFRLWHRFLVLLKRDVRASQSKCCVVCSTSIFSSLAALLHPMTE